MYFEIYYLALFSNAYMEQIKKILIVDTDAGSGSICAAAFEEHGFSVDRVSNGLSALGRIDSVIYDLVISELDLYYIRGADLYIRALKKQPALENRFLFIGAVEPEDAREKDTVRGRFFLKPLSTDSLVEHVIELFKQVRP